MGLIVFDQRFLDQVFSYNLDAYSKLKTLNLMKESSYNHRDQEPVEDFQSEIEEPEDLFTPE